MDNRTQDGLERSERTTSERPTLKTIAFMTGLGVTTVSRALKDAPDIGADTKERVRLVAKQIGYRPNRAGVRLRTGKTNVISLILNTEEEVMGLTSHLVYGISEVLAETQYHLVVTPYSFSNDPMDPVRYVLETASADGVILSRTEPDDARVHFLMENNLPFATHGRTDMGIEHPYHDFDNAAFAEKAVHRLVERGCRKIALLEPPDTLTYCRHMRAGLAKGLQAHELQPVPITGVDVDSPISEIKSRIEEVMRSDNRPDGLISSSGGVAFAIVAGIENAGFKLGDGVELASKQSTEVLEWFRPEIMVMFEDVREAGRQLAHAVLGHIEGQDPKSLQSLSIAQ